MTHTVVPTIADGLPLGDGLADGLGVPGFGVPVPMPVAVVAVVPGWIGGDVAAELVSGVPTLVAGDVETALRVLPVIPVLPVFPVGALRPGDRPAVPVPCWPVAPALGAGVLACAAPMAPGPVASGVWMILMETADASRNPITAAETMTTGTVLAAGWIRTMARAWPSAVPTRSWSTAAASGTAGSPGLRPIRPCWRSRRNVAARCAGVSPGSR